ncbi:MAG TPA: hypothetical protein VD866_13385 [Urbifossiella sp.]|nr:hypothetical protein [Urbifossiella sp.]
MRCVLVLALTVLSTATAGVRAQDGKEKGNPLVGDWELVAFGMDGARLSGNELADYLDGKDFPQSRWTFTDRLIQWPAPPKAPGKTVAIPYRVKSDAAPKQIDVGTFGLEKVDPKDRLLYRGIYKVTADTMVLCVGPASAARPEAFETKAKDGLILMEFRRPKAGR